MNLKYDPEADAAYINLSGGRDTEEVANTYLCDPREVGGMINLDFDSGGRLIGVEILDASKLLLPELLIGKRD